MSSYHKNSETQFKNSFFLYLSGLCIKFQIFWEGENFFEKISHLVLKFISKYVIYEILYRFLSIPFQKHMIHIETIWRIYHSECERKMYFIRTEDGGDPSARGFRTRRSCCQHISAHNSGSKATSKVRPERKESSWCDPTNGKPPRALGLHLKVVIRIQRVNMSKKFQKWRKIDQNRCPKASKIDSNTSPGSKFYFSSDFV